MSSAEEVLAALHDADDSTEEAADQDEQGALMTVVVVHLVGEAGPETAPISVEIGGGAANALRCVLLCPLQVLFLLRSRAGRHLIWRLSRAERCKRSLFPFSHGLPVTDALVRGAGSSRRRTLWKASHRRRSCPISPSLRPLG